MFCENCGAKIVDNALFCTNCGIKKQNVKWEKEQDDNNSQEKTFTELPTSIVENHIDNNKGIYLDTKEELENELLYERIIYEKYFIAMSFVGLICSIYESVNVYRETSVMILITLPVAIGCISKRRKNLKEKLHDKLFYLPYDIENYDLYLLLLRVTEKESMEVKRSSKGVPYVICDSIYYDIIIDNESKVFKILWRKSIDEKCFGIHTNKGEYIKYRQAMIEIGYIIQHSMIGEI